MFSESAKNKKSLFCSFVQVLEEVCKKQVLSAEHYALQLVELL